MGKNGGVSLFACFGLILSFIIQREISYDRSSLILRITAPEGSNYTDRFMQEISKLVDDSIPAKKSKFSGHLTWLWIFFRKQVFCASVTKEPGERKLSQEEIADKLTKWTKQYPNAKTSVTQQPTIAVNRRGGLPIQYIIQTQNFSKLEKIPLFMEAVDNDPTFQCLM
jgi:HAE1 family hydrophobic/amphiphilic exporter-1/multidrug efflux pump